MSKHFLFVILGDDEIVNLLTELRRIFYNNPKTSPIHITLRGPAKHPIEAPTLREAIAEIKQTPILINGAGIFEVQNIKYVYLKARSPYIEKYMFKPDFPKKLFNANPHITLFESTNSELANRVRNFLNREIKPLYCHEFEISSHLSRQLKLPFIDAPPFTEKSIQNLIQQGKVKTGIFNRAKLLIQE